MIAADLQWQAKQPDDSLSYTLNLTDVLGGASLTGASAAAKPSGAGELSLDSISAASGEISVTASGGVAGRNYLVKVTGTTSAGSVFEFIPQLPVDPTLAVYPPSDPPSDDFGPAITWPP